MNRSDAGPIMARLTAAYPSANVGADTLEVYYESALALISVELATQVVQRIIAEDKFWPTPARFHEVRRSIEAGLQPAHQALEAGEPPPEGRAQVQRLASEARKALKAAKGRQHNHKGGAENPCPVCGGHRT